MALWRAMNLCLELDIQNVIFEGDAKLVVEVVNNEEETGYGMVKLLMISDCC